MANVPKPPFAIRITRPYDTEDEFLAHELESISRTSVTLVGAQQRPDGVVLRFELALASGAPLLRGEGRVVGYRAAVMGEEPGLTLRFTRLDSKSKALVDRVGAMRESRRSVLPPPPAPPASPDAPSPEETPSANELPPLVAEVSVPALPPPAVPLAPPPAAPSPPVHKAAPADREALLTRLRERQVDVEAILVAGAARRQTR